MLPNWITLARFPLLLVNLVALYLESPSVRLAGAGLRSSAGSPEI